ncbi:MAG: 2-polyprenyl-3-methyl-6-methoxy-1,4-benzoquinone monooxygenase [Sulfuricellaceae bacterium]|nr:2-polyprenyl-3-methyl-6-methoxy-1,4-benzoquinone monooxygenase [Sulfuricellaceae bacterium]
MLNLDQLIVQFDKGLRTVFAPAQTKRPLPGDDLPEAEMSEEEKRESARLMRINHSGEICAQALYQGQALTARNPDARAALEEAAWEETEHLHWTENRVHDLGGRKSLLNPLWYANSLAVGMVAGALGDKWNLGFLAETERQVCRHLDSHLGKLPPQDAKSRAIVEQMKDDEARHATTAIQHGGTELPLPVKLAMKGMATVMTKTVYWV